MAAPPPAPLDTFNVGTNVYVRALAVDAQRNSLWVGTSVGALEIDLAKDAVKNTFTRKDGLANEYVFALGVHPTNKKVWFGTNAGGASTWDGGDWKVYFPMHGLADYWVYSFAFDKAGGTWIGTWDGANYVTPAGEMKTYRKELINIWVYGLTIDDQGRVWFGTEGGVSMFDGTNWASWTHDDGLGAKNIADLPRSTNTGLGTRTRHDLIVETAGRETYNPNYVFSALSDKTGRGVWFGTWGGGASLFDGKTWRSFSTNDGLAGNIVYSMAQDADGGVWFGTNHGVSHYDGAKFTNFTTANGLLDSNVYAIAVTDGGVWFGTKGGVSRLPRRK
jgi:ligand-binding sensor domain-containing protein